LIFLTEIAFACETQRMIVLDEPAVALADRFHEGAIDEAERAAHPVLARWHRVHRAGHVAESTAEPVGTSDVDLAERRERLRAVFREESSLLAPITEQLAAQSLLAILADPSGVILETRGGGEFLDAAARVRLVVGAHWSEGARGTNAIGTAIVERRAIGVVGRAHFETSNHGLFCYATPIRDAYDDVVAVVDVTGAVSRHDAAVALAVRAVGSALENALFTRELARSDAGGASVVEALVKSSREPALLVDARGGVRAINDGARQALGLSPRSPSPLDATRVFGVDARSLFGMATRATEAMTFETERARFRVAFDPVLGPDGRPVSLLIRLSPLAAPRAVARPTRPARAATIASPAFDAILGSDARLLAAKATAARLARTTLPVLLLATTGTGKELFARAIHAASPRASKAFVALNCGALTPSILESELFGHAPGSFTGASARGAEGKLASAHEGTLFLDEIAEMPAATQAALLRVLDDGVYFRVGESAPRSVDFRLVCATCRDLPALVESGAFRRDLFYRIHGGTLTLPPFVERTDKVELARALLAQLATKQGVPVPELDDDAIAWIEAHDWPGNVRELKTAMTYALAMCEDGLVGRCDFPEPILGASAPRAMAPPSAPARRRDELLRDAASDAMRAANGNISEAARNLGVSRSTLYRLLRH
jgi:transcriptional regulator of acetoin/glycerol metabolism